MILQAQRLTPYSLQSSVRYSAGTAAAVVATTNTSPRRIGGGRLRRHGRDSAAATSAADHGGETTAPCCSWHRLTTRRRSNGSCLEAVSVCLFRKQRIEWRCIVKKNNGASYAVEWRRTRKCYDNLSNRINIFFSPVHFDDSRIKNNLIGVI